MVEETIGEIRIKITDSNVEYDSELSMPEVIFWLETLKTMVLKKVIENGS